MINHIKILPFLVLLITFTSLNPWNKLPLGNTFVLWAVDFITIGVVIWLKHKYCVFTNKKDYFIIKLYFVWMLIGVIRGIFVAENYWEWKQLIEGSLVLSLPIFVYAFSLPSVVGYTMKIWIKYALPAFILFFFWITPSGSAHFYLAPIFMLSCFLSDVKKKWRYLFIGLLLFMLFVDLGARSQVIKSVAVLGISGLFLIRRYLTDRFLKIIHWMFYILPVLLLVLGISGVFNVLEDMSSKNEGKYIENKIVNGEMQIEDISGDTRTKLYEEVIESAIRNNYVLWGRTPARGNDSSLFGYFIEGVMKTGKYERYGNEFCFPNVFTWLGLIGMLLYCFIYLKSSYLAVCKSNNIYLKLLGVFIAFRFMYGWIEDINRFDNMNIALWMVIAMGFSEQFRNMNNRQFNYWLKSIF